MGNIEPQQTGTPVSSFPLTAPLRVLVVEDDAISAEDISRRLKNLGFEVSAVVASGENVLSQVRVHLPGLVLLSSKPRNAATANAAMANAATTDDTAARIAKEFDIPVLFSDPTRAVLQDSLLADLELALYRHRENRELRRQKAWLSTVLTTTGDGIVVTDAQGSVGYLNEMAEKMTGWSHGAARNQPLCTVVTGANPDSHAGLERIVAESLAQAATRSLPRGFRMLSLDGRPILVEGEIRPSVDELGTVGAVLNFRDATERDSKEQELRHEQKMQAIGRLAAGVAHDFNNFLMIILGYSHELQEEFSGTQAGAGLSEIAKAAASAAAVTKLLVQFSRKQRGAPVDLDLNQLALDMEPLLRRVTGERVKLELELGLGQGVVRLHADPDHMRQILLNLVSNARESMTEGGAVTIKTGIVAAEDAPTAAKQAGISLSVRDTGAGMTDEVAEVLFEPFFTTKDLGKGAGLGLSIVYSMVHDLGGTTRVETKLGGGSVFTIYLPQSGAAHQELEEGSGNQEWAGLPGRSDSTILLVEDNETVRDLLVQYLAPTGYTILTAYDGPSALEVAERYSKPIDALLTDVMMPGMNGFELAKEFASRGLTEKTLFISGYADEILGEMGLQPNSHFLPKPFSRQDLIRELNGLLRTTVGSDKVLTAA